MVNYSGISPVGGRYLLVTTTHDGEFYTEICWTSRHSRCVACLLVNCQLPARTITYQTTSVSPNCCRQSMARYSGLSGRRFPFCNGFSQSSGSRRELFLQTCAARLSMEARRKKRAKAGPDRRLGPSPLFRLGNAFAPRTLILRHRRDNMFFVCTRSMPILIYHEAIHIPKGYRWQILRDWSSAGCVFVDMGPGLSMGE